MSATQPQIPISAQPISVTESYFIDSDGRRKKMIKKVFIRKSGTGGGSAQATPTATAHDASVISPTSLPTSPNNAGGQALADDSKQPVDASQVISPRSSAQFETVPSAYSPRSLINNVVSPVGSQSDHLKDRTPNTGAAGKTDANLASSLGASLGIQNAGSGLAAPTTCPTDTISGTNDENIALTPVAEPRTDAFYRDATSILESAGEHHAPEPASLADADAGAAQPADGAIIRKIHRGDADKQATRLQKIFKESENVSSKYDTIDSSLQSNSVSPLTLQSLYSPSSAVQDAGAGAGAIRIIPRTPLVQQGAPLMITDSPAELLGESRKSLTPRQRRETYHNKGYTPCSNFSGSLSARASSATDPKGRQNAAAAAAAAAGGSDLGVVGGAEARQLAFEVERLRKQLTQERKLSEKYRAEAELATNQLDPAQLRSRYEDAQRVAREQAAEIAALRKQMSIQESAFNKYLGQESEQDGTTLVERYKTELDSLNVLLAKTRRAGEERQGRLDEYERREKRLLRVMPTILYRILNARDDTEGGGSARASARASGPAGASGAGSVDGLINQVVAEHNKLLAELKESKASAGRVADAHEKLKTENAKLKREVEVSRHAYQSNKRTSEAEMARYKELIKDLEARIMSFADEYESLLRDYKIEVMRNAQPGDKVMSPRGKKARSVTE